MKRTRDMLLGLGCALLGFSALAEHQVDLRGIVNMPRHQAALLQVDQEHYILGVGEQEEGHGKGQPFKVAVLQIDLPNDVVITRIDGQTRTNSLPAPTRSPSAKCWIRLVNADFHDCMDLCGYLAGRTILLHPLVNKASFSCEASWTEPDPAKDKITDCFREALAARDAVCLEDGDCFLQVIPTLQSQSTSRNSPGLPAGSETIAPGLVDFENVDAVEVLRIYGRSIGKQQKQDANPVACCSAFIYFKTTTPLSKSQTIYAFETILEWNGVKIIMNNDNTFSVSQR